MKFVLFLPTKEEVLLLLPTAKCTKIQNSIVTWIFEGFFLFFKNCCSTLSLNHLALNVSKWRQIRFRESEQSGAGGELDRPEFRGRTLADNHFSRGRTTGVPLRLLSQHFLGLSEGGTESTLLAFSAGIWNQSFTKMFIPVCSQCQSLWRISTVMFPYLRKAQSSQSLL